MNYYNKYLKYKKKYLSAKGLIQKGGGYDFEKIIKIYQEIPETGLYNLSLSKSERLKIFSKYCKFLIDKTINNDDVVMSKEKRRLEKQNLTDSSEYKELIEKISSRGKENKEVGDDFEIKSFKKMREIFEKTLNIDKKDLTILTNPKLYYKEIDVETETENWNLIGEIDAVIIQRKKNINYIIGICEMKFNFDDIPDALFQIKRSFNSIEAKSSDNIKLNDIILDDSYKLESDTNYYKIGYIFTSFDNTQQYYNLQSKIRHYLINMVHLPNISNEKIFKKILNKQISYDKFFDKEIKRYAKGVIETIEKYKSNNLLKNIQII